MLLTQVYLLDEVFASIQLAAICESTCWRITLEPLIEPGRDLHTPDEIRAREQQLALGFRHLVCSVARAKAKEIIVTQDFPILPGVRAMPRALPPGIRWSAATAAFQVEGARSEGGRGRSIWDEYVDTPGLVKDQSTAEPGPDSYHRYLEDVQLAQGLGLDRYRFGISWARVLPEGSGLSLIHI